MRACVCPCKGVWVCVIVCVCVGVCACGMIVQNGQNPMAEEIWKLIKSLKVDEVCMYT